MPVSGSTADSLKLLHEVRAGCTALSQPSNPGAVIVDSNVLVSLCSQETTHPTAYGAGGNQIKRRLKLAVLAITTHPA